jgi:hypothetical protein
MARPARDSKGRFKKKRGVGKTRAKKAGTKGLGATFKAKASFAKNKDGSLRKGCKRVKKQRGKTGSGRKIMVVEYRCTRPGRKRRRR